MKYPDWNNRYLLLSGLGKITIPENGLIFMYGTTSRDGVGRSYAVYINEQYYYIGHSLYGTDSAFFPVRKGDTVQPSSGYNEGQVWLIPYK